MVKMLLELDIQPMAEMVETADEHEALKRLGFLLAQGFYYGRPSSVEDCLEHRGSSRQVSRSQSVECAEACGEQDAACSDEVDTAQDYGQQKSEIDADARWLLSQPSDNYTLQIMVSTSKRVAMAYVDGQDESESFKIVDGMGTRRHLFSVFHGSFGDRAVAKEVAKVFKDSTCCPLVRKFSSVQAEVKRAICKID